MEKVIGMFKLSDIFSVKNKYISNSTEKSNFKFSSGGGRKHIPIQNY